MELFAGTDSIGGLLLVLGGMALAVLAVIRALADNRKNIADSLTENRRSIDATLADNRRSIDSTLSAARTIIGHEMQVSHEVQGKIYKAVNHNYQEMLKVNEEQVKEAKRHTDTILELSKALATLNERLQQVGSVGIPGAEILPPD